MLRPYQENAVDAVYRHLQERDDNPVVVLPTGAGKSWVIAQIAADATRIWNGRVLVLAHRRELLEQNADKMRRLDPDLDIGIYSAGLDRRERDNAVIVAGIQSIWKKAALLGAFDLVLVDECHLLGTDEDGMYRKFLADAYAIHPPLRLIGLTATPYRLKSGPICAADGMFHRVCYEIGVKDLIVQGYLSPLIAKAGREKADTEGLHVRGGEFVAGEVEELMNDDRLVEAACEDIVEQTRDRKSVLIFASGVQHAKNIARTLKERHGIECGFVCGETPPREREELLARFRSEGDDRLKFMVNVDVLTTGFDAPQIDCVALLRPTLSPGLFYQAVGRGFRLHPGKKNCLVLDFGGNVLRHGPVDDIRPRTSDRAGSGGAVAKECPKCRTLVSAAFTACPSCGHEFPSKRKAKHDAAASTSGILTGQVTVERHAVQSVTYSVHQKRGADDSAPRSMRVDYKIGYYRYQSEWVCFEHDGYARDKAAFWWRKRSHMPVPATAREAVEIATTGSLAETRAIRVRSVAGDDFDKIVSYELGPVPETDADLPPDALDFPFGCNAEDISPVATEEIPW